MARMVVGARRQAYSNARKNKERKPRYPAVSCRWMMKRSLLGVGTKCGRRDLPVVLTVAESFMSYYQPRTPLFKRTRTRA